MENGNFIDAKLEDGVLEVTVKAKGPRDLRRPGSVLMDDVFAHFGPDNIRTFDALWVRKSTFDTNYKEFMSNIQKQMNEKDAAWNTWTGRQMRDRGFTRVEVEPVERGTQPELVTPRFIR